MLSLIDAARRACCRLRVLRWSGRWRCWISGWTMPRRGRRDQPVPDRLELDRSLAQRTGPGRACTASLTSRSRPDPGSRLGARLRGWVWRAMARSAAWRSASNSRHHPAVVRGLSGWACRSSSGWACPRRWSSALALSAAALMSRVPAAQVSYRMLPASSRCRSAASCRARVLALAAPVSSCCTSASADCRRASASACAVTRKVPLTSSGALAWARSPARTWASSSPRCRPRRISASSRISSAVNTAITHVLEFGVAAVRLEGDGLVRVGDPGGFAVGGGQARAAGVFLAQRGGRVGDDHAELAG